MHYNLFLLLTTLVYSASASGVVQPWNEADDYTTNTIAGKYVSGFSDGDLTNATFNRPMALAIDHRTQELYVVDHGNHAIRRVRVARSVLIGQTQPDAGEGGNASDTSMPDAIGAQDYVTTLAGGARGYRDGVGTAARFSEPSGCAIDPYTRLLFVADTGNNVIREIDLDTAMVTTLAGAPQTSGFINGRGQAAAFRHPTGVALAIRSRQLFVCDAYNHAIRVIHTVTREVRTLAGTGFQGSFDGAGHVATFHLPFAAAVDEDEELVYVAEMSPRIRVLRTALEPTYPQPAIPSTATIDPAFTIDVSTKLDGEGQLGIEEVAGLATAYGWPGGALMFTDAADDTIYRLSLDEWYPPPIAPSPPLVAPPPGGINGSDALNVVVTDDIGGGTGGGTGTGGTGTGGATAGNSTDTVASAPLAGRMLSDDHWRMLSESTPLPPASPPNASEMTPQMPPLPPHPPPPPRPHATRASGAAVDTAARPHATRAAVSAAVTASTARELRGDSSRRELRGVRPGRAAYRGHGVPSILVAHGGQYARAEGRQGHAVALLQAEWPRHRRSNENRLHCRHVQPSDSSDRSDGRAGRDRRGHRVLVRVDWPLAEAEPHLYHPALVELLLRMLLLLALLQILLAVPALSAKVAQAED